MVLSLFFLGLRDDCHRVHTIQEIMNRELFKAYNTISGLSFLLLLVLFQSISGRADWIICLQRSFPVNFAQGSSIFITRGAVQIDVDKWATI